MLFFWSNRQHITGKWPGLFSISMNEQFLPNNFFQFIDFQWLLVFSLIWYGTDCYLLTPNVTVLQRHANNSSITNLHFRGHCVSANLKFAANNNCVQILPVSFPVFVTQLLIVIFVRYYGVASNVFTICAFIEQITGSKLLFSLKLAKIILPFLYCLNQKYFSTNVLREHKN